MLHRLIGSLLVAWKDFLLYQKTHKSSRLEQGDSNEKWTWGPKKEIFVFDLIFIYVITHTHL